MSFILGIDTSTVELGVGLASERGVVLGVSRYLLNSHAEHISHSIDFLLSSNAIAVSDVGHAVVAVGPGSFTGLRIGISFLKGLCFGRAIKVLPVSSLESAAFAWHNRQRPIVVAFDARNGEVFWARFEPQGNALARTSDDALTQVDEMISAIEDKDVVITDSLGYAKSAVFDFLKDRPGAYSLERYPVQRGLACARLGMQALKSPEKWVSAADILPRYLSTTTMEKRMGVRANEQ